MVANPDFFWIRISDYDPDFGFQIRIEIQISDYVSDLIRISDFRSGFRISIRF
jgi:hypothetical protein